MWPSWVSLDNFRVFARCLSRSDSLIWSARRRRALGFDMVDGWRWLVCLWNLEMPRLRYLIVDSVTEV